MKTNIILACLLIATLSFCGYLWRENRAARAQIELKNEEIAAIAAEEMGTCAAIDFLEEARNEAKEKYDDKEAALTTLRENCRDMSDSEYFEYLAGLLELSFDGEWPSREPVRAVPKASGQ